MTAATTFDEMALEEELARVPLRRKTLARVVRYLAPHRKPLLLGLSIESFWCVLMLVDPWLVQQAVDGPLKRADLAGVFGYVAALVAILAFRAWITVIELRITSRVGVDALHAVRKDAFDHLQRLSMRYFDRTKQGRIIARIDRDVDSIEHLLSWGTVSVVNLVSMLVFAFARLAWAQPAVAPWAALSLPILWGITRLFEKIGFPAYRRIRETHSAISSHVAERITGVRIVKAFAAEGREAQTLDALQGRYRSAVMRGATASGGFTPALGLAIQALLVVAVLLGAREVTGGTMSVGDLVEAVWLVGMALSPIDGLGNLYNECLVASAAAERIFLLLDTTPEIRDADHATDPGPLEGDVEFEHVSFGYDPTSDLRQLHDVSFRAKRGERVALVGHTGAGKTTVANLLARFYEPQDGTIRFDGRDARGVTSAALHAQMGIVLQESFLFGGTVLDNLRFVKPDLTESEATAGFAALGCMEVLAGLSSGLCTDVGERGANLSEGERQIVCLVRAWISRPAILIFDEATSAVDTHTEALLIRALRTLSSRQTTFVIAHRLSTIRDADKILVFDHGRLAEEGRHADLLAKGGVYARLYAEYAR